MKITMAFILEPKDIQAIAKTFGEELKTAREIKKFAENWIDMTITSTMESVLSEADAQ